MMGIDRADAAVAKKVVAREQQFPQSERQLSVRVARRVPDLEVEISDADPVAVLHERVDFKRRHVEVDVLSGDLGIRHELVARFEWLGRQWMCSDRRLKYLLGFRKSLHVIDIGMRGDKRHAFREREV